MHQLGHSVLLKAVVCHNDVWQHEAWHRQASELDKGRFAAAGHPIQQVQDGLLERVDGLVSGVHLAHDQRAMALHAGPQ